MSLPWKEADDASTLVLDLLIEEVKVLVADWLVAELGSRAKIVSGRCEEEV